MKYADEKESSRLEIFPFSLQADWASFPRAPYLH